LPAIALAYLCALLLRLVLQDPLGIGRSSNDNANARSMAMAYNSLAKVLAALRHSAPAGGAAAAPSTASALANGGLAAGQQQHVPWRDSPLTRWLQERLHAATAITMLGTVSASTEVGGYAAIN
jgi:kinesin family protein 4/21/27